MQKLKAKLDTISWSQVDRLAPVALLILILMLCWKLASLFWWTIAPPQLIQVEPVNIGSQQSQVPNISAFSLFQETGATASSADANLVMQLQGVFVASPSSNSSAVIKVNEVSDRYIVGENIENSSYRLSEVYWDHVVLQQSGGATKELLFSGIENLNQSMLPEGAQQNSAATHQSASNQAQQSSSNSNNSQRALGQAIDQIQENREQYLKNMGVNASSGQGYEVTDQTPSALRNKLGLRSGDRILSLNGQSVGQGQSDVQLLEQAKKEGKVRIEIKRGGQVMTIQQDL
ncbi:MAG: PDZ domain-containing protein [Acinetobacter sp.]|nr:PDZ domain-containing protein [Acinetobacter sp.]